MVAWPDKKTLERWYCEDRLDVSAISERIGCAESTLYKRLMKLGISRRPANWNDASWPERETLEKWHWNLGLSQREIADKLGFSVNGVRTHFDKFGISAQEPIRHLGIACEICSTEGGYRTAGAEHPERISGKSWGVDKILCKNCYNSVRKRWLTKYRS